MAVRIITESAADFDAAVAKRRRVEVVPMTVQFGNATFLAGKNLSNDVFFQLLQELKGEGTLAMVKTYTRFEDVRQEILKGKDPRGTIVAKLKDPGAEGGQTERWQIGNVALSEFGIEWETGAVVKQETPFTFTPTDMINLDMINPQ